MTGLQEYDLGFKPVHTIKGHSLCRLAAEVVNTKEEGVLLGWEQEIEMYNVEQDSPTIVMNS